MSNAEVNEQEHERELNELRRQSARDHNRWAVERLELLHKIEILRAESEAAAIDAMNRETVIERLRAERDAAVADARRYQWLREAYHWPAAFDTAYAPEPLRGDDLDAAIDAAIRARGGEAK